MAQTEPLSPGAMVAGFLAWWQRGLADALLPDPRPRGTALRWSAAGLEGPRRISWHRKAVVHIDPACILIESARWPAAAFPHLAPMAADRALAAWPLAGAAPASGWHRARRLAGKDITVTLALVRPGTAAAARAAARAAGWRRVDLVATPQGESGVTIPLLQPAERIVAARATVRQRILGGGLVALLLLTLPGQALLSAGAAREAARAAASQAREAAAPAIAARAGLTGIEAGLAALAAEAGPGAGHLLSRLAATLPEGVTLSAITLTGTELRLSGAAPEAAPVLSALQGDASLGPARFTGPVLRDPGSRAEQFEITVVPRRAAR